jgi:hypothetical protein
VDANASEIEIMGKWTSRAQAFITPEGSTFEWRYARKSDEGAKRAKLLVLEKKEGVSGKRRRIAQLVRNEQTRPQGTSKTTAGNGGELVLDRNASDELDEALVVATCLLMLKKEIDRRRTLQTMVILSAVSSG